MRTSVVILLAMLLAGCSRPERNNVITSERYYENSKSRNLETSNDSLILLRTTPIADQGRTSYCWIYAMLACIETERIEHYGDSLRLSADFLIDCLHKEQAAMHRFLNGRERITQRGMGPDALALIANYGLAPQGVKVTPSVLAQASVPSGRAPGGSVGGFYLYGMHYTPQQFGRSVYREGEWQFYTSFSHHPYGEKFVLEVPDNYRYNAFHNVPIDTLLAMTINSLKHHHPVFWEGSMKENKDFNALNALNGFKVLKAKRQALFEHGLLTDDHAMAIVGLGSMEDGTLYFILKNSWGEDWGEPLRPLRSLKTLPPSSQSCGYCCMTLDEFCLRTMAVGLVN